MAQLVDLVGADRLLPGVLQVPGDVAQRAAEEADAGAGERDLRGGGEHQRPVLVARGRGQAQHVDLPDEVVGERVHRVGVVPEQPEIRCGRAHLDQPPHLLPGEGDAGRVGEHRHAPHALDGRVGGDELLDQVDVGTVLAHRDVDHLDVEALGDREVPVVAGHRTEELDGRFVLNPRPRRIHPAVQQRDTPRRRASARGWRCCPRSGWAPGCRAARRRWRAAPAGRAGRRSCGCRCRRRRGSPRRQAQQRVGQVELRGRRLAAGQVELSCLACRSA